jgi:hypothetical protein
MHSDQSVGNGCWDFILRRALAVENMFWFAVIFPVGLACNISRVKALL